MASFEYMVRDDGGLTRRDVIQAGSREAALTALQEQNLTIVYLREARKSVSFNIMRRFGKVDDKSLLMFTRQLATMVAAGMPIVGALNALARQGTNQRLSLVVNLVRSEVEAGTYLSKAMAGFPDVFSDLYVGMVAVGETSGQLPETLDRLAVFLQKDFDLKRKVQAATTYPAFVLTVGLVVIWGLVTFVIPRFVELFGSGMNTDRMPVVTRIMVAISQAMGNPLVTVLAMLIIALSAVIYRRTYRDARGRLVIDRFKLAVPGIGNLVRTVAVARMCRTLGTLLGSAVPILQGLDMLGKSTGNAAIEQLLSRMRGAIMSGEPLAQAMSHSVLFPPMVIQMVRVGESTGTLDAMLNRVADFYDAEVDFALGALAALIEPVMVVGLGGMVLFIVLAVMLPILSLVQTQL